MVRPYKNGGGGGKTAHSVPLPGGCSDRAAPAGGLPKPRTCLSGLRRRPGESMAPSSKGARMRSPGEPRALPSGGSTLAQQSSSLRRAWWGRGGRRGWVRTGVGPLLSLCLQLPRRHPRPLDGPTPWARRDAPRGSCNFPETSAGAGKLQRVPAARVPQTAQWPGAGRTAEECVMGAFGSFPGSDGSRATPASLAVFRARPGAPAGVHTSASRPRANSNAAVSEGAVRDAAVRDCIWPGNPRRVLEERAEIPKFSWVFTRLGTPRAAKRSKRVTGALLLSRKLVGNTASVIWFLPL